jgi:hypothetical protein
MSQVEGIAGGAQGRSGYFMTELGNISAVILEHGRNILPVCGVSIEYSASHAVLDLEQLKKAIEPSD